MGSTTKIDLESSTIPLCREERLEQSGQRRQIARLNQQLTRAGEFGDDAFAADHAAKETRSRFTQAVLRRSFPRDQVAGVNDVALARLQSLSMDCAKGRNQKQSLPL